MRESRAASRGLLGLRFSHEQGGIFQQFFVALYVLIVFDAFVFADAGSRAEHERAVARPRAGEDDGVLDGILVNDRIFIDSRELLDDVELFAVDGSGAGEPGFVIEAGGIHYQSVAFPMAYGVAHEAW